MMSTSMKKKLIFVLSIVSLAALLGFVILFAGIIITAGSTAPKVDGTDVEYSIIVNDKIYYYDGLSNFITPYLVGTDGSISEGNFEYSCYKYNTESALENGVEIDKNGKISLKDDSVSSATISIFDRSTKTQKRVSLFVVSGLQSILGITNSNGEQINEGTQYYTNGQASTITVVTEPKNVEIENNFNFKVTDSQGNEKKAFDLHFDGNKVTLIPEGLGNGNVEISLKDNNGNLVYSSSFAFSISLNNETLYNSILSQSKTSLMSKKEIEEISTVTLNSENTNLKEYTDILPGIKNVYIESENLISIENMKEGLSYFVPENLYRDYWYDTRWTDYQYSLFPYNTSDRRVKYVIYHCEKTNPLAYEAITNNYKLQEYELAGFDNSGWVDENGVTIDRNNLHSKAANGIHLFAVWGAKTYKVVYHIQHLKKQETQEWPYQSANIIKTIDSFSFDTARKGYSFLGWSTLEGKELDESDVDYIPGNTYNYENIFSDDEMTVHLYDVWKPAKYTVSFTVQDELASFESMEIEYGATYELPEVYIPGYTFEGWTGNGMKLSSGENTQSLTDKDGEEVVLNALLKEITYTLEIKSEGGNITYIFKDEEMEADGSSITVLRYTQTFDLPNLKKEGHTSYHWVCDETGDRYEAGTSVSKLCEEQGGTVTLRAVWE